MSIRTKFVLLFALGLTVLFGVSLAYTAREIRAKYVQMNLEVATAAADNLIVRIDRLLGLGLHLDEFSGFNAQCTEVARSNRMISHVFVVNSDLELLYHGGDRVAPIVRDIVENMAVRGSTRKGLLLVNKPLRDALGDWVGSVVLVVDEQAIDQAVIVLLRDIVTVSAVLLMVGTLIVLGVMKRLFLQPATKLLRHIEGIDSANDLVERNDELGVIARAHDALVKRLVETGRALQNASRELERHNLKLDDMVRQRTRALEEANAKLEKMANTDELTGLPNRHYFMIMFRKRVEHAKRHGRSLALILLDLNGFKLINDTYGHEAGDFTLRLVSERVVSRVRAGDAFCRLGGDEFVLLVEDFASRDNLAAVADILSDAVSEPFLRNGNILNVSASLGIAVLDKDTCADTEAMLHAADLAMYESKTSGRRYCFSTSPCRPVVLGSGRE